MFIIKLNFFINNKFERVEIYVTKKQMECIVEMRNNPDEKDKMLSVAGSGIWFSPKDILYITEVDSDSAWWREQAPEYFCNNFNRQIDGNDTLFAK